MGASANPGAVDWKWEGANTPSPLVASSQRHEPTGRLSGFVHKLEERTSSDLLHFLGQRYGRVHYGGYCFPAKVAMWWSRTLGSQKQIVGLQQTQAGNAPTIVRHAILVLPSPFWLEVSLVSPVKASGGSVSQRYPVLPTPEQESLLLQR